MGDGRASCRFSRLTATFRRLVARANAEEVSGFEELIKWLGPPASVLVDFVRDRPLQSIGIELYDVISYGK